MMAFQDAVHNRNEGIHHVLDVIAGALRAEAEEDYVLDVFDRHVEPHAWEQKVAIVREFLARLDPQLRAQIRCDQPESYTQNYKELVKSLSYNRP